MEVVVTSAVMGVLKHQKLMELKNSGVVDWMKYHKMTLHLWNLNRERYKKQHRSVWFHSLINRRSRSLYKSFTYFKGYTQWTTKTGSLLLADDCQIFLDKKEIEDLQLIIRAGDYAWQVEKVVEGFRSFDELLVDSNTGKAVDWLLHNKVKLKDLLQNKG